MATTTETNVHSRARASVGHDRASASAAILLRLAAAYLWNENLSWKNPPDFGKSDGGGLLLTVVLNDEVGAGFRR